MATKHLGLSLFHLRWMQRFYAQMEAEERHAYLWFKDRGQAMRWLGAHLRGDRYLSAPDSKLISVTPWEACECKKCVLARHGEATTDTRVEA